MTVHNYTKSVNPSYLSQEINDDVTITTVLDHIDTVETAVTITFVSVLSAPEITALDAVVVAHTDPPVIELQTVWATVGPPDSIFGSDGELAVDFDSAILFERIAGDWGTGKSLNGEVGAASAITAHEATYNHINYNTAYTHVSSTANPHSVTKTDVGLSNVPNTDFTAAVGLNTAKVTNATHTGEVTGDTVLTITDNTIDEANMKINNSPIDDYVLTAASGVTGGWKWAINDHGVLIGLSDDDHPQYLTTGRGDDRYYTEEEVDDLIITSSGVLQDLLETGATPPYIYAESNTVSATTSTTYQTKISITFGDGITGRYRLAFSIEYQAVQANKNVLIRLYDSTDLVELSGIDQKTNSSSNWFSLSGIVHLPVTGINKIFELQYAAGTSNCNVRHARLEARRTA